MCGCVSVRASVCVFFVSVWFCVFVLCGCVCVFNRAASASGPSWVRSLAERRKQKASSARKRKFWKGKKKEEEEKEEEKKHGKKRKRRKKLRPTWQRFLFFCASTSFAGCRLPSAYFAFDKSFVFDVYLMTYICMAWFLPHKI